MEEDIRRKYIIETKTISPPINKDSRIQSWNTLEVTILQVNDNEKMKIGGYSRDHPRFFDTFYPFIYKEKEYALYASHYTFTRIMELPSCKDIGCEESSTEFLPVEFYIPPYREIKRKMPDGKWRDGWLAGENCFNPEYQNTDRYKLGAIKNTDFGFVAGYYWGDDITLKIQFLDLSEVEKGIIERDERFGYIQLPHNRSLKESIHLDSWSPEEPEVGIEHLQRWNYEEKRILE